MTTDVPTTEVQGYHRSGSENGNDEAYDAPTPYPAPWGRTGWLAGEDMVRAARRDARDDTQVTRGLAPGPFVEKAAVKEHPKDATA
jgi:hypothetical protein